MHCTAWITGMTCARAPKQAKCTSMPRKIGLHANWAVWSLYNRPGRIPERALLLWLCPMLCRYVFQA